MTLPFDGGEVQDLDEASEDWGENIERVGAAPASMLMPIGKAVECGSGIVVESGGEVVDLEGEDSRT